MSAGDIDPESPRHIVPAPFRGQRAEHGATSGYHPETASGYHPETAPGYHPETASGLDDLLACLRAQMDLDSETEHEVLAEIRDHLEEAVAEARDQGLDEAAALARAADRFGLRAGEGVGRELQAAHAGWGTADAVIAAGLPVVCALVLRWLVFAPDGTALGWPELLSRPAFWVVSGAALLLPLLKFERRRYALAVWALFWALTVIFVTLPASRW